MFSRAVSRVSRLRSLAQRAYMTSSVVRTFTPTMLRAVPIYSVRNFSMAMGVSDELLISLSMNYNNSGSTNTELCDNLKKNNIISTPLLEYAFRKCDRGQFDPSSFPYEDKPHDIGAGATISSTHMHCIALEAIADAIVPATPTEPTPIRSFLDVGSGSGYVTAIFATVIAALRANPKSTENANLSSVIGIELHPELAAQSIDNLRAVNPDFTDGSDAIARIIADDAFAPTTLPNAPFDAIHCGVASKTVPFTLLAQLKPTGKIVVPVSRPGSAEQDLVVYSRKASSTAGTVDFMAEAAALTPETSEAWLQQNFDKKVVMRCIYSLAQNKDDASSSIPVMNPRTARAPSAPGKYSQFFKGGESDPSQQAAYDAYLKQQEEELARLVERLAADVKFKQGELDRTAEEVKQWHLKYVEAHGRKPSLVEMNQDPALATLLRIVKELRVEVTRAERALAAAQKKQK